MKNTSSNTIVAINDVPDQLELLAVVLRDVGYHVLTAESAAKGLKIARRVLPDLILSDVMMPEMDGIELCRQVRADEKLNLTPILLVSAMRKETANVVEGLQVGADDYIEVPYDAANLAARAARLIERKRMQDILRENEKRFRSLIENVSDVITILSPDGVVLYESPSIENVLGYKPEELLGKNSFEFIHPEDLPEMVEYFKKSLKSRKAAPAKEYRFRHKNDSWQTIESVGKSFSDPERGKVVIVNSRDVTERKNALEAKRESENRLQTIFDNAAIGIALVDMNGSPVQTNKALEQMLGYSDEELRRMTVSDFTHPDDIERNVELINEVFAGGRERYQMEKRYVKKNGEIMWGNLSGSAIRLAGSDKQFIIGMVEDITARKKADVALRESEERFRTQYKGIPIPTCTWKKVGDDFVMVDYNDAAEQISDGNIHDFLGIKASRMYDDTPELIEDFHRCFNEKSVIKRETPFKFRTTGAEKHLDITFVFVPPGIVMVHYRDITAQIEAEESLRKSEERFQLASYATNDALWDWDLTTNNIWYSDSYYKLLGYSREDVEGNIDLWLEAIHPEDKERVLSRTSAITQSRENYWSDEYRLLTADGSYAYIFDRGYIVRDEGKPVRMIGAAVNITERKLAEQALQTNQARLQKQNDVLNELTKHHKLFHVPLETAVREITEIAAQILETERVSVWLYNDDKSRSRAIDLYKLSKNHHSDGFVLTKADYPKYFDALAKDEGIAAHNVETDARTSEFSASYLAELGITSILDVPIRMGGQVVGFISHEHIGTAREWKLDEQNFAGSMAGLVSLLLEANERQQAENALAEANERAIREYDRLLQRLSTLAQTTGAARDLETIFRSILDFAHSSVPCSALFISLYDEEKSVRKGIYLWYNGKEVDVEDIEAIRVGDGYIGQAIRSGEVTVVNEFMVPHKKSSYVYLGFDEDDRQPRSTIIAPMKMMGKVIGAIEIQSYDIDVYTEEHATAMRMAANIAANAIENVRLLEQERRRAEQLQQSQKLESVGRLAGGIAHDFNNMLTAINGYSDLTLRRLSADDPLRHNIEEIKKAGERSAALTHQLLAFSRRQVLKPKVIDLNQSVIEISTMLKRLIGEDVHLITKLDPTLGRVEADPGQLTQVIMNLAVNARDAMPEGGELTIETANVYLDEEYAAQHVSARSGHFVMLSVTDTGIGMDDETLQHIFEPFYTTKETGKGTGLGLATVYGIVKQSGGYIWVYSESDSGAIFKIYLPRIDEEPTLNEVSGESEKILNRTGTILLVEDEEMVRNLSRQILETCGYEVIEAANGAEALALCEQPDFEIDLVITDVVMPKMSGRQLAEQLAVLCPGVKVLYMSGYTDDEIVRQGIIETDSNFIQKPFTFKAFAGKVKEVLEAKKD